MLSLTSVSASEVVIGDVADKFKLPCQRVLAVAVTVCRRLDSNRRWLTPGLKATDLDHSATTPTADRQISISRPVLYELPVFKLIVHIYCSRA